MEWGKFAKIVVGENIQAITQAKVAYFQTRKRKRYGTVRDTINRVTTM